MLIAALLLIALPAEDAPRAPLLPEGTIVSQATGTLAPASRGGGLVLQLVGKDAPADGRIREFRLLPSRVLEDLEALHATDHSEEITVTGALTVFDGQNWLLPVHVEREMPTASRIVPDIAPISPDESSDAGDDESVADIVADLESAVSTLRRGVRTRRGDTQLDEDVADDLVMVSRRGRMTRDPNGAWVLLLEADNLHTKDGRLILLPSAELRKIVANTKARGPGHPILISGTLQHYRGRRYLLPSGWRTPHERPNLKR